MKKQIIEDELSNIIRFTPDYYGGINPNGDYQSFLFMVKNLYNFIKNNPQISKKNNNNIQKTIDSLFGDNLSKNSRNEIAELIRPMVSSDSLSKQDLSYINFSSSEFYHGTGSRALKDIIKHKKLFSEYLIYNNGIKIQSGERYKNHKNELNKFISLLMNPRTALNPHAFIDGIRYFDDYPVVLGFNEKEINKQSYGRLEFNDYDSEPGELCVRHELPLNAANNIFVPEKHIHHIKDLTYEFELDIMPIEVLGEKLK